MDDWVMQELISTLLELDIQPKDRNIIYSRVLKSVLGLCKVDFDDCADMDPEFDRVIDEIY